MIIPVDVTLAQLRAFTKTQLINKLSTWLTNNFTKRQLILWLMDSDVINIEPVREYYADGQIKKQVETVVDTETKAQVSGRVTTWTYYPTGEVDTITIKRYDATKTLIGTKKIKHYTDGRQPTATEE